MASYRKRGETYHVEVRRKGHVAQRASFPTMAMARAWAARAEGDIVSGRAGVAAKRSAAELLTRYAAEVIPKMRGAQAEGLRAARLARTLPFRGKYLGDVTPAMCAAWRDARSKEILPISVRREMSLLSAAWEHAQREWQWVTVNPWRQIARPPLSPARTQRVADEDLDLLAEQLGWRTGSVAQRPSQRVAVALRFAVETGMRAGEICALTPALVRGDHVHLPKEITKNGHARDVPLSARAQELLKALPESERVFGLSSYSLDVLFRKARDKLAKNEALAHLGGIHFHDTRREGLSRMARDRNIPPMELAKISGHRDLNMLLNTYYAPEVSELTRYFQTGQ